MTQPEAAAAIPPADTPDPAPAGRGLHTHLRALVLGALVPGILATGLAVWSAGSAFHDTAVIRLSDTARTLAGAVESELETVARQIAYVGDEVGPPSGVEPSPEWFAAAGERLGGRVQRLSLASGEVPRPEDGVPAEVVSRAIATGRPAISNLFGDDTPTGARIAIAIPRREAPGRTAVTLLSAPPPAIVRALQQRGTTLRGILVAVTDGTGHLVARSLHPERFIGQPVPDWKRLQDLGAAEGVFDAKTKEGGSVVFAFRRLGGTPDWVVVVGEPASAFAVHWRGPLASLVGGTLLALLLALIVAARISRQILQPVRALVRHGRQVARDDGTAVAEQLEPSTIREFEVLRRSYQAAESTLRRREETTRALADQLARSERRYRAVAESGALVFWRTDHRGQLLSATGWQELTGRPEREALGAGWLGRVHADDHAQTVIGWKEAFRGRGVVDVEFRVRDADGQWRWVRARGAALRDDAANATECVGVLEDVDARRQAQARVVFLAHHDSLTGLANRVLLRDRLEEAVARARRGRHGAILCLDLDRFKEVNDTLGHPVGDALLQAVTERLRACVREADLIARLGGDEFAIIQAETDQPSAASALAPRLIETIGLPYEIAGKRITIGVSVGIAIVDEACPDADHLLKNADVALYRAKEEGRGRFCFFEPGKDARMQQRHQLDRELARAALAGEFTVHYQPLVHLKTGALTGFEALLRWDHPTRGQLLPADFLGAMEDSALIVHVGEQVLRQACADAATWPDHLRVSVNLSPAQLAHRDLAGTVESALARSRLDPRRLEIEIAESTLAAGPETAAATLLKIKALGVRVVMDDFGTGRSSLGYLRMFPFDKVKIDRAFIRDLADHDPSRAIVRAVTGLCGSLGIAITAEGIETEAQLALLHADACTEGQGFLFGRPKPASEARALAHDWSVHPAERPHADPLAADPPHADPLAADPLNAD